jgi:hypothetical protein
MPNSKRHDAMIRFCSLITSIGVLVSCGRNESSQGLPHQPALQTPEANSSNVRASADALILDRAPSGLITEDSLRKLISISPQLLKTGILIDVVGSVPDEQIVSFKDVLLAAVKQLGPKAGEALNPKYPDAVRLAKRLKTPELASIVFDHLKLLPSYRFPTQPLPSGWGDAELSEHSSRGVQGLVASTVVELSNEDIMQRYRSMLRSAPPNLQRVMIWALGRSPDPEDFELLWQMRKQIDDAAELDTLKRALNAIPVSMERVARYPEARQIDRTNLSKAALEALAAKCRQRLNNANMVVSLTIWD